MKKYSYIILYIAMKNLKIPSRFVIIIRGIFKGYTAEIDNIVHKGELLNVNIGPIGRNTTIPVEDVKFLSSDGGEWQYIKSNEGYHLQLVYSSSGEALVLVEEPIGSPGKDTALFLPEDEAMDVNRFFVVEGENESGKDKDLLEIEENPDDAEDFINEVANNYKYANEQCAREAVHKISGNVEVDYLDDFFSVLGFTLDNLSINTHYYRLKNALQAIANIYGITTNNITIKIYIVAYIFLWVNNMGIGYPIEIDGCRQTSNDDPRFIMCVGKRSGFIEAVDLQPFIEQLANVMDCRIIQSVVNVESLTNRFNLASVKSKNTKVTKVTNRAAIAKTKNYVLSHVTIAMRKANTNENKILQHFYDNFNEIILNVNHPFLKEKGVKSLIIPFINDYIEQTNKIDVKYTRVHMYDNIHVKEPTKQAILAQINIDSSKVDPETLKVLSELYNNFDRYVKFGIRLNLNLDKKDAIIRPYIVKYYELLKIKEEEFYKNPVKSIAQEKVSVIKLPTLTQLNKYKQDASKTILKKIIADIKKNIDPRSPHKEYQQETKIYLINFVNSLENYNNNLSTFIESADFDNLHEQAGTHIWDAIMPYIFEYQGLISKFEPMVIVGPQYNNQALLTEKQTQITHIKADIFDTLKKTLKEQILQLQNFRYVKREYQVTEQKARADNTRNLHIYKKIYKNLGNIMKLTSIELTHLRSILQQSIFKYKNDEEKEIIKETFNKFNLLVNDSTFVDTYILEIRKILEIYQFSRELLNRSLYHNTQSNAPITIGTKRRNSGTICQSAKKNKPEVQDVYNKISLGKQVLKFKDNFPQ